MPIDRFGRTIDYLRLSVIDHCNLRCVYCMPIRPEAYTPASRLLRPDQIETIVRAAASVGFRKIRLTGGEPTLRDDLAEIAGRIRSIPGIEDLALTTNGVRLPALAQSLRDAGVSRVNIHIDSLDPQRLSRIMRFGVFEEIWEGIQAAERAGFHPIKLNAAVVRDYNDRDVVDLARLTIDRDWHMRFIELMPLGGGDCAKIAVANYVPSAETMARIESALGPLTELPAVSLADESRNYRLPGARGVVGFISPVSQPYCDTCNRMRLTADGKLHLCLLHDDELDLAPALHQPDAHARLAALFHQAVEAKPTGHALERGVTPHRRAMYQIGG